MLRKLLTRYITWNARGVQAGFGNPRARMYIETTCWFFLYWFHIFVNPDEIIINVLGEINS